MHLLTCYSQHLGKKFVKFHQQSNLIIVLVLTIQIQDPFSETKDTAEAALGIECTQMFD